MEKINKAIKFFEDEIVSLRKAPELNGCEMTTEWMELMQIYNIALESIKCQHVTQIKTNYDRIKAMNVEKFAEELAKDSACEFCIRRDEHSCDEIICKQGIIQWLESEAVR